jgi:chaperone required for assembly of F1-ATPase
MSTRDMFDDTFRPLDATEAARRAVRPQLRRRFYRTAAAGAGPQDRHVLLDGRPAHTPARNALAAPTPVLGQAIAAEWEAQREVVDPATMPLTRLANSIIDGVVRTPDAVSSEVGKYLDWDLLFYRAEQPDGLVKRQERLWDPVLAWAHAQLGARFLLSAGVTFVQQPERALAAARAAIPADPWRLGAVHSITTLTGSALLALALLHGRVTPDEVWAAAHVDEDWQMEQWGEDSLALARRAFRFAELQAAATVLACCAQATQ